MIDKTKIDFKITDWFFNRQFLRCSYPLSNDFKINIFFKWVS